MGGKRVPPNVGKQAMAKDPTMCDACSRCSAQACSMRCPDLTGACRRKFTSRRVFDGEARVARRITEIAGAQTGIEQGNPPEDNQAVRSQKIHCGGSAISCLRRTLESGMVLIAADANNPRRGAPGF